MMPGIDGIEVCKRIKSNPLTQHIPVVMVTALDQPEDRVRGLEAGADDFLTKPVNDVSLFCRVKSLVRLEDAYRRTAHARRQYRGYRHGAEQSREGRRRQAGQCADRGQPGVDRQRIRAALAGRHEVSIASDPQQAAQAATDAEHPFELIVVNLDMEGVDALRICSHFKSLERTRQTPVLIIVDPDDHQRLLRALDMGVNDYLIRPIDKQELLARVNTQIRRYRLRPNSCGSVSRPRSRWQ